MSKTSVHKETARLVLSRHGTLGNHISSSILAGSFTEILQVVVSDGDRMIVVWILVLTRSICYMGSLPFRVWLWVIESM